MDGVQILFDYSFSVWFADY